MHACLSPCPCSLRVVSINSMTRLFRGSILVLCVLQHLAGLRHPRFSFSMPLRSVTDLCSLLPGLTRLFWKPVYCICDMCRCHVMTSTATLHQQRPAGGVGDTSPARGRPFANSCCTFAACACFQVTSCIACCLSPCVPTLVSALLDGWAWSDFPTGGGAPGLSLFVLLHASMSTHPARHECTVVRPQHAPVSSCALQ
jgi:hypothetical protein